MPLAVTAGLVDGDLQISLNAANDKAFLLRSGADYLVSGTGLKNAVVIGVSAVQRSIVVQDTAAVSGQVFTIKSGGTIASPLRVAAGVESTTVAGVIATATAGDIVIQSPRVTLAASVSTAVSGHDIAFGGAVTLARHVTLDAGAGDISFAGTVNGGFRLVANATGTTSFRGVVGGTKPLVSLTTDAGGSTSLAASVATAGGQGQCYADDVVLAGTVTIKARAGSVQFLGRVDSSADAAAGLVVMSSTTTTFGGPVGGIRPVASLSTDRGGTTVIGGGTMTTAAGGFQLFNDAVRITRHTVLDAVDGPIRFARTVDGSAVDPPGMVVGLSASPGNGQVSLTWSAPAFTGGGTSLTTVTTNLTTYAGAVGGRTPLGGVSRERAVFGGFVRTVAILDYVVQYSLDGGAWRTIADGRTTTTSATVTGLQTGRNYAFRVWAVNNAGDGTAAATTVTWPTAISFSFVFGSGSQYWSATARQALESAAATLASALVVSSPVNIVFQVTARNSPSSSVLASAGSDTVSAGAGFFRTVAQHKLIAGVDANGAQPDGAIEWNFGHSWAYGDAVSGSQYDFRATAMHELLHAFGFLSYVDAAGTNTGTTWTSFDRFVTSSTGTAAINPGTFRWNAALDTNLTGGNGGLYFAGTHAVAAYGGPVPLYTPNPWESGSSMSHLDDATFTGASEKLMNATVDTGPGVRVISPVELAILRDLGYTVATG